MILSCCVFFAIAFAHNCGIQALIVPDEIPSLLSIIYSNIPTVKKGTDSRIGYGFRLGNRADAQVLVELGPQKNTQPLANQKDNDSMMSGQNKKRSPSEYIMNTLKSANFERKYPQIYQDRQISNTDGGRWLEKWRNNYHTNSEKQMKQGFALGEIDAKSVIPPDSDEDIPRHKAIILREIEGPREFNEPDDEEVIKRALILLEQLHKEYEREKRLKNERKLRNQSLMNNANANAFSESSDSEDLDSSDNQPSPRIDSLIEQTAEKLVSTLQNATYVVSAIKNRTNDSDKQEEIYSKLGLRFVGQLQEGVEANTSFFNPLILLPSSPNEPEIDESAPSGHIKKTFNPTNNNNNNMFSLEDSSSTFDSSDQKNKNNAISLEINFPPPTNPRKPKPNESFVNFLLRRLGYYDFLINTMKKDIPLIPEKKRNDVSSRMNISIGGSSTK